MWIHQRVNDDTGYSYRFHPLLALLIGGIIVSCICHAISLDLNTVLVILGIVLAFVGYITTNRRKIAKRHEQREYEHLLKDHHRVWRR